MPVPRRDLDATRARLLAWLRERLPGARDVEISTLRGPDATGFSNDTLLFELRCEQDGRRVERPLVCRIEPTGFAVFPVYDVARQYRVMAALAGSGVPVPEMLWLETDPRVLGAPFFVMEQVAGRIPSDHPPYHAEGWLAEAEPDERAALWWSALDVLAAIHRCDPVALGLDFLDAPPPGDRDAVAWQLAAWRRYADWVAGERPQEVVERGWQRLVAERPPAPREAPGLCWGDARIGNMIFRDRRCVAVLDWEMATLGPPEMDLGWFLLLDRHHSEGIGVPRLAGLPGPAETVARYEERLGRRVAHLAFWELFAAWRFAVILRRVAQQMMHLGILPADSAFETDNTASRLLERLLEPGGAVPDSGRGAEPPHV